MPRAKNDAYKRKSAQALNHLAAAILDVNDIYLPFESQMNMLQGQRDQAESMAKTLPSDDVTDYEAQNISEFVGVSKYNAERYEQYVKDLTSIMMGIAAIREHIILFIGEVWGLDEDSVKVYMG